MLQGMLSRPSFLCLLAAVVFACGSLDHPFARYIRHASCPTCNLDRPDALSSPWYGRPIPAYTGREQPGMDRETQVWNKPSLQRVSPPYIPSYDHRPPSPSESETCKCQNPFDFRSRPFNSELPTPPASFGARSGGLVKPAYQPSPRFNPQANRMVQNQRNFKQFEAQERYPSRFVQDERVFLADDRVFQSEKKEVGSYQESRPAILQYRSAGNSEEEDGNDDESSSSEDEVEWKTRPRIDQLRPNERQVQPSRTRQQLRRDRSQQSQVFRTSDSSEGEEVSQEHYQPDLSGLRYLPTGKSSRNFFGPFFDREEFSDVREETPFGYSEQKEMDRESFGFGGFQSDRVVENIDTGFGFGGFRQSNGRSGQPQVLTIQSREVPKEQADRVAQDNLRDGMTREDAMVNVPAEDSRNSTSGEFPREQLNPDFYGDIVYPPVEKNEDSRQDPLTEPSTTLPPK